jgi:myo-inositol 2-dehydrogenase / D-chiro-inositol 1-dehydrogenase
MAKKKVVLGLMGAGRIGKMHGENILAHVPNAFLKSVADSNLDKDWAERVGIPERLTDVNELLADKEIEAVVIATPSSTHVAMIQLAAAAGKQIFCEKPIALSPEDIKKAVNAAKEANVKLQVGFNRRFDPEFRKVHQLVQEGKVGDIHIIKLTNRDPLRPSLNFIPDSGGLFKDFSIHDMDTLRFISGCDVEEIYASGTVLVDPEIGKLGDIDTALIIAKLTNGALCMIDLSRETKYGYDQQLEVLGTKGCAAVHNTSPTNASFSTADGIVKDKPHFSFVERYKEAYIIEIKEFIDCVQNNQAPLVTGDDALAAMQVAQAAGESFKINKPVRIER